MSTVLAQSCVVLRQEAAEPSIGAVCRPSRRREPPTGQNAGMRALAEAGFEQNEEIKKISAWAAIL
ncbi:hypothetical protein, partial [Streptomyces sp. NPDC004050]